MKNPLLLYEGEYMTVRVVDTGLGPCFAWQFMPVVGNLKRPEILMTNTLGASLWNGERLELIRNGEVFDWAEAGWFGTHADGPGFQGFEKLTGHRFHMQGLDVEAFQVDDEIRIHPPAQMVREKRVPNVWERRVWGQFIWPIDSHEGLYLERQ